MFNLLIFFEFYLFSVYCSCSDGETDGEFCSLFILDTGAPRCAARAVNWEVRLVSWVWIVARVMVSEPATIEGEVP